MEDWSEWSVEKSMHDSCTYENSSCDDHRTGGLLARLLGGSLTASFATKCQRYEISRDRSQPRITRLRRTLIDATFIKVMSFQSFTRATIVEERL